LKTDRENTKAVHVWLVLWKAYRAVEEAVKQQVSGLCLGDSDFRVLEVLLHKGPLPVNTIGPKVELTPGSISVAVDRLEERGLVKRKLDPQDRRIRTVYLTAEGESAIQRVFAHHEREMERLLRTLTRQERSTLISLLKKLGQSVQEQSQTKAARTEREEVLSGRA
jgi:MarR family 2-MHQ and catechol resistance regulon transcriptional repressor